MSLTIEHIKQYYWQQWEKLKKASLDLDAISLLEQHTKIADKTILNLVSLSSEVKIKNLSIVATGGYARKQLFPYSDIDLLILYNNKLSTIEKEFIEVFTKNLWDIKIKASTQIRNILEIENDASKDEIFKTSLLDNRFITGSEKLYQQFLNILQFNIFGRNKTDYLIFKVKNVRQRGKNLYLLEPNIKDAPGGLRDINTIYWICKLLFFQDDLSILNDKNILSVKDLKTLKESINLMFKIRIRLHYFHNRNYDVLNMEAQNNIADTLKYMDTSSSLGVEVFMKHYYSSAKNIFKILTRIINLTLSPIISPINNNNKAPNYLGFGFYRYNKYITFKTKDLFTKTPEKLLLIHLLSIKFGLSISDLAKDVIKKHLYLIDETFIKKYANMFLKLISSFPKTSIIIQNLIETEILQKFIPEFNDIICKPQFDYYHHYTVDEHTIIALSKIDDLANNTSYKDRIFVDVFNEIKRKDILAIIILLHDIGKGKYKKNHSVVGSRMVNIICKRWGLNDDDIKMISNLVKYHLIMNHFALRRDINDIAVLKYFLRRIKSLEELNILFLLTYADMNAVGGQTYSNWVNALIIELYLKVRHAFTKRQLSLDSDKITDEKIKTLLLQFKNDPKIQTLVKTLDKDYVYKNNLEDIKTHIELISQINNNINVAIKVNILKELDCLEFIICTHDYIGLLKNIAAVFLSFNLNILGAQINTFDNGLVVDIIQITKKDIPVDELIPLLPEINKELQKVITLGSDTTDYFKGKLRQKFERKKITKISNQVIFDNSLSKNYTIVDIFTADKVGLLFNLLDKLEKLNINIVKAIISTDVDRVVDTFYITNHKKEKIENELALENIKKILEDTLSNL